MPASLATYMVPNEDGRDVETILIGREGAVGGIVSEGYLPAYTRIMVKFGGPFVRLQVGKLEAAKAQIADLAQRVRALCRLHAGADVPVDRLQRDPFDRAAHREMDRFGDGAHRWRQVVPLTHEQLATLLGVGRSYASRVIQIFKAEGVLETRRGSILVRNPRRLRLRACLCNESVKNHFEEVLRGVYPAEDTPGS